MTVHPDWPITFFDEDYLKIYQPQLTEERNQKETEFIAGALDLPRGATVLDLACGIGRHAIGMARLGYQMTGVDFNPRYLESATAEAERVGAKVRWMVGDMRSLHMEEAFDGAYSYFTSFGYFEDRADDLRVLQNVRRSLRPGGVLVMDVVGKERLARVLHPTVSQRTADGALLVQRHHVVDDWSRVRNEWTVVRDGRARTFEFLLRIYSGQELKALLDAAGFARVDLYGALDGRPYDLEAERLVAVARR